MASAQPVWQDVEKHLACVGVSGLPALAGQLAVFGVAPMQVLGIVWMAHSGRASQERLVPHAVVTNPPLTSSWQTVPALQWSEA